MYYSGKFYYAKEFSSFTSTPIRFSSDGTKFYISVSNGIGYSRIHQYNMTVPWDISTASYSRSSEYFTSSAGSYGFGGFFIGNNGFNLYIIFNNENLRQYTLTTAWDISTAVYANKQTTLTEIPGTGRGFIIDPTGTYLMIIDDSSSNLIRKYTLSTPWDISVVNQTGSTTISTYTSVPYDVYFKPDGLKFYFIGNRIIHEFTVNTAWELTPSTYISSTTPYYTIQNLVFSSDGTKVFFNGPGPLNMGMRSIESFDLTTPWDISRISNRKSLTTGTSVTKIAFSTNGDYVFYTDGTFAYRIPLSTPWDLNSAGASSPSKYTGSTSITSFAFSSDGTKIYLGPFSDSIRQYTLGAPWDLTTFLNLESFFYFQDLEISDHIAFSPDGTSLFISGYSINTSTSRTILQYKLSTPWDISTASFSRNGNRSVPLLSRNTLVEGPINPLSTRLNSTSDIFYKELDAGGAVLMICNAGEVLAYYYDASNTQNIENPYGARSVIFSAQLSDIRGIDFSQDGLKMFLAGNEKIFEYSLSQAFNTSTATYTGNNVTFSGINFNSIRFSSDGTKLFAGSGSDTIREYSLSTPWSITSVNTTPINSLSATSSPIGSTLTGISFSADGRQLLVCGESSQKIVKYNLPTSWTLSGASLNIYNITTSAFLEQSEPSGIALSSDGRNIFVLRNSEIRYVYRIELSTPYDLSTSTPTDVLSGGYVKYFNNSDLNIPRAFDINKSDGTSFYVTDGNIIRQYTLENPYNFGKIYTQHFALGTYSAATFSYLTLLEINVTIDFSTAGREYVLEALDDPETFSIVTLPPTAIQNTVGSTGNITFVSRDSAPLSTDPGVVGQAYIDDYYFYIYTGTTTGWKRTPVYLI
jgi:hypothetical protein